jgi:Protein of unknown function (DUF3014).
MQKGAEAMGRYDLIDEEKSNAVLVLSVVLLLAAGGGWFYWHYSQEPPVMPEKQSIPLPLPTSSAEIAVDEHVSSDEIREQTIILEETNLAEPVFSLPTLADSDSDFRAALLRISAGLEPWLQSTQLLKKYTTIANDFAQGLWLEKHMRFLKQAQPFATEKTANGEFMAKLGYQRYDALAAAINAIDPQAAMTVYRQFRPLFLEVFNDFGYPADRPLEDLFLKSAAQILAAPIVEEPIALKKHVVFYKYADDKLEALNPVAKQMLRMGPDNARTIQNKVRQLVEHLVNMKD